MAETKKKIIKFVEHDEFKGTDKEISLNVINMDGANFEEILGTFRQFLMMTGYSDTFVKRIIQVDREEMELLKVTDDDLEIYNWDVILRD